MYKSYPDKDTSKLATAKYLIMLISALYYLQTWVIQKLSTKLNQKFKC